jgi:hypothetical protein
MSALALCPPYEPPQFFHDPLSVTPTSFRISVIARAAGAVQRDWRSSSSTPSIIFVDPTGSPMPMLSAAVSDPTLDVARVILDGGSTTRQFLNVLASAPTGSLADILWICDDGSGYLSSVGRGGDRVLYALRAEDVRFYLEVSDLVTSREMLEAQLS